MKYITVKLTEDQAWAAINAIENDWEELQDVEFETGEILRYRKAHNAEVRRANAFRERLVNKIKAELVR